MAIEIKELIIKMTVSNSAPEKKVTAEMSPAAKNRLIEDCVKKVLQKLDSKIDR